MPQDMPDRIPEDLPDNMPEDMPDRMPEDMPEDMPDRMPEDMPDRMPEDMSDRMPEDLPVRKCINVMVGITRSKVIVFIPCAGPFITAFFFPEALCDLCLPVWLAAWEPKTCVVIVAGLNWEKCRTSRLTNGSARICMAQKCQELVEQHQKPPSQKWDETKLGARK